MLKTLFDVLMIVLTGGFWIIWMIVRHYHRTEKRRRRSERRFAR